MLSHGLPLVIPTYRLRDVGETIESYDENFRRNGHTTTITVFDDSNVSMHEKYFEQLERTTTANPILYVGPLEKEAFIEHLNARLKDRKLESIVRNLFRPSYGGNRNFTLIYTLGEMFVSVDDDMRPYALVEHSPESLSEKEISRGKLSKVGTSGYSKKYFDILASFSEVLGKRVSELPEFYERGDFLTDTSMDLETNASKGVACENSLIISEGNVRPDAIVKMAQTFRSGTNDIDALDFINMFLDNTDQNTVEELKSHYVLVNFRPVVTNKNWRMDCGVAAYDNRKGLPPFFPTRLRFEDYIYRLWIQQDHIVSAHVDSAQNHLKSNYMRNPLASEIFNEELANLLKRKIKDTLSSLGDFTIAFDYDGQVTTKDTDEILDRIRKLHQKVIEKAKIEKSPERQKALLDFVFNLEKVFYGFESDFFQQNVSRIVDDVVCQIRGGIELWPTLLEICFFEKHRQGLPQIVVKNQKAKKLYEEEK